MRIKITNSRIKIPMNEIFSRAKEYVRIQKIEKFRTKFAISKSKTFCTPCCFFKLGVMQNILSRVKPITQLERIEPRIFIELFLISYNFINDINRAGLSFTINNINVEPNYPNEYHLYSAQKADSDHNRCPTSN